MEAVTWTTSPPPLLPEKVLPKFAFCQVATAASSSPTKASTRLFDEKPMVTPCTCSSHSPPISMNVVPTIVAVTFDK